MRVDISYSDSGNGRGAALFEEQIRTWLGAWSFDETSYPGQHKYRVLTWLDAKSITTRRLMAISESGRAQKLKRVEVEVGESWS